MKPAQFHLCLTVFLMFFFCHYFSTAQTPQCLNHDEEVNFPGVIGSMQLHSGDFNNDGSDDVVVHFPQSNLLKILYGSPNGMQLFDEWTITGLQSIAVPGDINGDNYDDIVITFRDTAYIYVGTDEGPVLKTEMTIPIYNLLKEPGVISSSKVYKTGDINRDSIDDFFLESRISDPYTSVLFLMLGASDSIKNASWDYAYNDLWNYNFPTISPVGDINGDGYLDFLRRNEFELFLTYGGTIDFYKSLGVGLETNEAAWAPLGDINGDGYDDLMLSYPSGRDNHPLVYIYPGSLNGLTGPLNWKPEVIFTPETREEEYGALTGTVGDINGDGFDDFFIHGGSYNYTVIYYGSKDLPNVTGDLRLPKTTPGFKIGQDVNADGYNDLLTYDYTQNQPDIWIYHGVDHGLKGIISCPAMNEKPNIILGGVLAESAGDVNGDGNNDLLIGFPEYYGDWEFNSGAVIVHLGAPNGVKDASVLLPQWDESFGEVIGAGDFNGDGLSDVAAGHETYETTGAIHIFYGSLNGVPGYPDLIMMGNTSIGVLGTNLIAGDFNGDNFDDIASEIRGNTIALFYGTESGPSTIPNVEIPGNIVLIAGDVNDDGFDDFFVKRSDGYHLYWGSTTHPIESNFILGLIPRDVGDLNNDGFDDIVSYNDQTHIATILLGNKDGFSETNFLLTGINSPSGIGDINGDGFDDISVVRHTDTSIFDGATTQVDIHLGTANGIHESIYRTIRSGGEAFQHVATVRKIGDINDDGVDDIGVNVYREIWIFYGRKGTKSITCREDTTIYANNNCLAVANGIGPKGLDSLYQFNISGATTLRGSGSANGHLMKPGINYITYKLVSDTTASCTFSVTVMDTIKPNIRCINQTVCRSRSGNYSVPKLILNETCGLQSITYSIEGPTNRGGTGIDASGYFNKGRHTIIWVVTDSSGNQSMCTALFDIVDEVTARISKAYQVNAQQSAANTIYLGFANNTLRLVVNVGRSNEGFKYKWSTGDTTRFTRIRHNLPGKYEHWVVVPNSRGCRDTARTVITVVDNYCPNAIKEFVTIYFPQLLNESWMQSLLMQVTSSYACYNGKTICIPTSRLKEVTMDGAVLGKCNGIMKTPVEEIITSINPPGSDDLHVSAHPNPSSGEFNFIVKGTNGKPYSLRIINSSGILLEAKYNIHQSQIRAGAALQKGVYYAEIRQGTKRKMLRLLKIK